MYLLIRLRVNNNNQIKTLIRNRAQSKIRIIVHNRKAKVIIAQVARVIMIKRNRIARIKVKVKRIRAKLRVKVKVVVLKRIVYKIQKNRNKIRTNQRKLNKANHKIKRN